MNRKNIFIALDIKFDDALAIANNLKYHIAVNLY